MTTCNCALQAIARQLFRILIFTRVKKCQKITILTENQGHEMRCLIVRLQAQKILKSPLKSKQ